MIDGAAALRQREVRAREFGGAGEKYEARAVEAVFFDRPDDRGLAAGFGERAGGQFFVEQAKFRRREAALFEQRLELRSEQRRRAGDYNSVGVPFKGHASRGSRNHPVPQ